MSGDLKWFNVMVLGAMTLLCVVIGMEACKEEEPPLQPLTISESLTSEYIARIEPPVRAAYMVVGKTEAELRYRHVINQATIDALMDVPGVRLVHRPGETATSGSNLLVGTSSDLVILSGHQDKVYELKLDKAKAYTWVEIEETLAKRGLLAPPTATPAQKF